MHTESRLMLRALDFSVPRTEAVEFGRARLRITWDDRPRPSIDAPLALFFGTGTLYNRDSREYLVKAFPMVVRFDDARVYLACYFPMPFLRSARIELVGNGQTGIEEWGGGGDYWGGRNMTLPFAGHPVGARKLEEVKNEEDKIHSAYRFLLADLMPFGRNALIRLEHGGENQSTEHYETVTYWYGLPSPSLIKTDTLQIGDGASELFHRYVSPNASEPYSITSRYEWGVDTI